MKIVIAGGNHEADYIVKMFKQDNNKLVIVNQDQTYCEYISKNNKIDCICGNPSSKRILDEIHIENFDLLIALTDNDATNYSICQMAKKLYLVKRCVCTVINPKNVELFKSLGIDGIICSTYLLAQTVKNHSQIDSLIKSLSIEDEKIAITELEVKANSVLVGKTLAELDLPTNINVSCIFRKPQVIIPNGQTAINGYDRLVIVCEPSKVDEVTRYVNNTTVSK
ncbi:MAG: NAD-binding protein [Clostridia bacterium]